MLSRFKPSETRRKKYATAFRQLRDLAILTELLALTESKSVASYGRQVRGLVSGLWRGSIDEATFIDAMRGTIRREMTNAWRDGALECGINPKEFTTEEQAVLSQRIDQAASTVVGFAASINANNRASGAKLKPQLGRAEMWTNQYVTTRNMAQQIACADRKLKWVWNPMKEHCHDCQRYNGRVYRASTWRKYNIAPQSRNLACGGYRCGCNFVPTTDPVTPGRPPGPSG